MIHMSISAGDGYRTREERAERYIRAYRLVIESADGRYVHSRQMLKLARRRFQKGKCTTLYLRSMNRKYNFLNRYS